MRLTRPHPTRHNRAMSEPKPQKPQKSRAEVKAAVATKMQAHYSSELLQNIATNGNCLIEGNLEIHVARAFGFCDGVRRAVDLAYATRELYPTERIWLIGEIIHNPEVNARLDALGLKRLPWQTMSPEYEQIAEGDVVIIPAFGVTVAMRKLFAEKSAKLVDTTCGHVVKVWKRVKDYARQGITSIIHGKTKHEESMATASHSRGEAGDGKFLIIFDEDDARALADTITAKMSEADFLARFKGAYSVGFKPSEQLLEIGMANQTTMIKDETERISQILRAAIVERDGSDARFHVCNTICGATQDRQNALHELLGKELSAMFIIGGYNSSNTTHLAAIAQRKMPTYFVKSPDCILNIKEVLAYDVASKQERIMKLPDAAAQLHKTWKIGLTAGASCPANLIEQVIRKIIALREES